MCADEWAKSCKDLSNQQFLGKDAWSDALVISSIFEVLLTAIVQWRRNVLCIGKLGISCSFPTFSKTQHALEMFHIYGLPIQKVVCYEILMY